MRLSLAGFATRDEPPSLFGPTTIHILHCMFLGSRIKIKNPRNQWPAFIIRQLGKGFRGFFCDFQESDVSSHTDSGQSAKQVIGTLLPELR